MVQWEATARIARGSSGSAPKLWAGHRLPDQLLPVRQGGLHLHRQELEIFSRITRGTLAWKKAHARRTAIGRSFKRNDYALDNARSRSKNKLLRLNILAGTKGPLDAWLVQTRLSLRQLGLAQVA